MLKAKFPILRDMSHGFSVKTQKYIPTACCAIHNFIRMHDRNDEVFNNFCDNEVVIPNTGVGSSSNDTQEFNVTPAQLRETCAVREAIARQIYLAETTPP